MVTARVLLEADDLLFAELECPAGDPEWGEDNLVTHPIVALPGLPVWQVHDGRRALVDATHTVLHHAGSEYRREPFDRGAYRCLFFFPGTGLVREIVAEFDPRAADASEFAFPNPTGPLDARAFSTSRRFASGLRAGSLDAAEAREGLYGVLRASVASAFPSRPQPSLRSTARAHGALVEEAKAHLTRRLAEPVTLDAVARAVHVSPYHLARMFRRHTGYSIHGYLTQLRLRRAVERLTRGPRTDIGMIGAEVGFATHSHFTNAFRRAFGVPPSAMR
jgi:AraC family transcriptional regulator